MLKRGFVVSKLDLEESLKKYIRFHKKYTMDIYTKLKENSEYLKDDDIKNLLLSYTPAFKLVSFCIDKIDLDEDLSFKNSEEQYNRLLDNYNNLIKKYNSLEEEALHLKKQYETAIKKLEYINKNYKSIIQEKDSNNNLYNDIETIDEIQKIMTNNQGLSPGSNYSNGEIYRDYLSDSSTQWD